MILDSETNQNKFGFVLTMTGFVLPPIEEFPVSALPPVPLVLSETKILLVDAGTYVPSDYVGT